MRRPSPLRGGDEADLFKQIVLLELLEWLTPTQGEFWYLESHTGEGRSPADTSALDWYASAAREATGWHSFPLWHHQQESLATGEYLGTSALALQQLAAWEAKGVNVRWVFSPTSFDHALQLQQICAQWTDEGGLPFQRPVHRARIMQLMGGGLEALQELAYLGGIRAPGLALLEPPTLSGQTTPLLQLMETLILRRFWVMLVIPQPFARNLQHKHSSHYAALYEGVEQLQTEGCRYVIRGAPSTWRADANAVTSEIWLLSPGGDVSELQEHIWERLVSLHGDILGRQNQSGDLQGVEVFPLHQRASGLAAFQHQFPIRLQAQLEIDHARDGDMPDMISLWERLMDEHAAFDEHFRRRPLARLYLRQSMASQINQPEYLLMVIRWKRQPIGFLSAQILRAPLFQESRIGQIVDVYIAPEWRNQHLGTRMVDLAMQWFRSLNIGQIDLNVAVHNQAGQIFWERQGLKPYLNVVSKEID